MCAGRQNPERYTDNCDHSICSFLAQGIEQRKQAVSARTRHLLTHRSQKSPQNTKHTGQNNLQEHLAHSPRREREQNRLQERFSDGKVHTRGWPGSGAAPTPVSSGRWVLHLLRRPLQGPLAQAATPGMFKCPPS